MSFDPFGQDPQPRPPEKPSDRDYPMEDAPPSKAAARQKVQLPAIFLIVVGLLNLLIGGYFAVNALFISNMPDEQFEKMMRQQQNEKQIQEMEKAGFTMAQVKRLGEQGSFGFAALQAVSALLALAGGVRMLQMKSYGLCVLAAVVSAVPCVSGSGCCCVGEIAGIWALIVLLSEDVRAGFR